MIKSFFYHCLMSLDIIWSRNYYENLLKEIKAVHGVGLFLLLRHELIRDCVQKITFS